MADCTKPVTITLACATDALGNRRTLKVHSVYGVDSTGATIRAGTWLTDALDNSVVLATGETLTVGACPTASAFTNTLFAAKNLTAGDNTFTTPFASPTGRHMVQVRLGATWGVAAGSEVSITKIDLTPTTFKLVARVALSDVDIYAESIGVLS